MESISVHHHPITLGQFLKFINLVGSGGEAKQLLKEGMVSVNGEVDTRRGRKLSVGDQVEIAGHGKYEVANAQA